jgi:hypothetical protein
VAEVLDFQVLAVRLVQVVQAAEQDLMVVTELQIQVAVQVVVGQAVQE